MQRVYSPLLWVKTIRIRKAFRQLVHALVLAHALAHAPAPAHALVLAHVPAAVVALLLLLLQITKPAVSIF